MSATPAGAGKGAWSRAQAFGLSRLVIIGTFALALAGYWLVYHLQLPHWPPVRSDGEGYYAYLPAYLVYGDPTLRSVVTHHFLSNSEYGLFTPTGGFGLVLQSTGNWLDQYPIGEAVLLMPFFLVGHAIALAEGLPADGYTGPELYAVGTGAAVYATLGLIALWAVLRRWFTDAVVAATLIVIVFGTSLFHYITYDSMFSHGFSFAAVAVAMLCALRWFERPSSWWRALAFGLSVGAVVDLRITDVVMMPGVLLLGVGSLAALRARCALVANNPWRSLMVVVAGAACLVPQLFTWWVATGHLIVDPYPPGQGFDLAHPRLLASLVDLAPHGLLPYAPALGLCVFGMAIAWWRRRDLALPVTVAFLPFWYLMSTWYDWSFSQGFGDRIYVNILPFLALPLALLFASVQRRWLRDAVGMVTALLVLVTVVLMIAYWRGRLPGDGAASIQQYLSLLRHP
jgi:hypothetical protein